MSLSPDFAAAWERRRSLHDHGEQTAYRLFNGFSEGPPQLDIDRLGDTAVVSTKHSLEAELGQVVAALDRFWKAPRVIVRRADLCRADRSPLARVLRGEAPTGPFAVRDTALSFLVDPLGMMNMGLFLDARPARGWIRAHAGGRRVLNLFAFTGSLGIAAAAGGAREVTHIDMKRGHLARVRANHELNGLPIDERQLVCGDAYHHLRRANRAGRQFGGIILNPPPQLPRRRGRRPHGQDYPRLARLTTSLLEPGGWLLCFFHRAAPGSAVSPDTVHEASAYPLEVIWRGASGIDFPERRAESKLRVFAYQRAS